MSRQFDEGDSAENEVGRKPGERRGKGRPDQDRRQERFLEGCPAECNSGPGKPVFLPGAEPGSDAAQRFLNSDFRARLSVTQI
jgi:hypothetical protein